MRHYYNDNDRQMAAWLRELIRAGHLPKGEVDERSIGEVRPADLTDRCGPGMKLSAQKFQELDLTVTRVECDTGTWWVWRRGMKQVHAGMDHRQTVEGKPFILRFGLWYPDGWSERAPS